MKTDTPPTYEELKLELNVCRFWLHRLVAFAYDHDPASAMAMVELSIAHFRNAPIPTDRPYAQSFTEADLEEERASMLPAMERRAASIMAALKHGTDL
jgi:hypothetical protein